MIGVHDWRLKIWKNFPVRSHEVSVLDFLSGIFISKNLTVTIKKLLQHLQIGLQLYLTVFGCKLNYFKDGNSNSAKTKVLRYVVVNRVVFSDVFFCSNDKSY